MNDPNAFDLNDTTILLRILGEAMMPVRDIEQARRAILKLQKIHQELAKQVQAPDA